MNMNETLKATGTVSIEIFDESGKMKDKVFVPNLVVTTGRDHIASLMGPSVGTVVAMSHMAIGDSNTLPGDTPSAVTLADTSLVNQLAIVVFDNATEVVDNTLTYTTTFIPGSGTGNITEAGIFNAATTGDMLCRTIFPIVTKEALDTMTITWIVTIS